jgi:hypothetical protein
VIHCAEVAGGEEATLETVSANRCQGVQRVYNLLQFSKSDLIIFYLKTRAYLKTVMEKVLFYIQYAKIFFFQLAAHEHKQHHESWSL